MTPDAIQAKQKTVELGNVLKQLGSISEQVPTPDVTDYLYHVLRRENVAKYDLKMDVDGFVMLEELQHFFAVTTDEKFTPWEVEQAASRNIWFDMKVESRTGNWMVSLNCGVSVSIKPIGRSEHTLREESYCSASRGSKVDSASCPRGKGPPLNPAPPLKEMQTSQSRTKWVGKAGEAKAAWLKAQELEDENEPLWGKSNPWSTWESHDSWQGWRWDDSWRTWQTDRTQWEREYWRGGNWSDDSKSSDH